MMVARAKISMLTLSRPRPVSQMGVADALHVVDQRPAEQKQQKAAKGRWQSSRRA
jgi:hypothetical protein